MTHTTRREAMALISGALAGTALGGSAFAQGTPKRGGILRISAPANPSSLDPATGGAGSDHAFLFTMYDTLTEWDFETLKPKPGLAESWNFTDPTTLVLNIRSGVTFHDGTPLDAEAVKFNLERNKTDPKSNIKADLASMASVEVTGPMQVTLKLKHAGRRAARHPVRPRRHDGVADRAQGCQRTAMSRARRSAPAPMPSSAGPTARRSSSSATRNTGSRTGPIRTESSSPSFRN